MADTSWNSDRLEELIGNHVEAAKLRPVLVKAIRKRRLGETFSKTDAGELLDDLSQEPGVLGVAARFAKVRLVLMLDE